MGPVEVEVLLKVTLRGAVHADAGVAVNDKVGFGRTTMFLITFPEQPFVSVTITLTG